MALVRAATTSDLWTIDPTSNAARVSGYDTLGNPRSTKAMFRGQAADAAMVGGALNITISGSGSKLVMLQRLYISGITATTVVYGTAAIYKYRSPPTGGTANFLSTSPQDNISGLKPTTLVQWYSAAPTAGLIISVIGSVGYIIQATTAVATGPTQRVGWDFRTQGENSGLVLRGTQETYGVVVGPSATTVTASIEVEWTEE